MLEIRDKLYAARDWFPDPRTRGSRKIVCDHFVIVREEDGESSYNCYIINQQIGLRSSIGL